jgi:hypothetical protein
MRILAFLLLAGVLGGMLSVAVEPAPIVPYPDGYRHWTFLHTLLVGSRAPAFAQKPCAQPCTAGLFHFYANQKAMEGLRTGHYQDGAVIAEELLEVHGLPDGSGQEGSRRFIGVMVRDVGKYAATGGWGFAKFEEGSRTNELDRAAQNACYQCHTSQKSREYVFTEYRER